jgi:ABC-type dipeptide/oligopeptide/nickel transport system permease subunit
MTSIAYPTGDNTLLKEVFSDRKIGRLERFLGPENYRILKGLLRTPASVMGFILIGFFILVAVFAPVIIPPVSSDPYRIPRDGFSGEPKGMGSAWKRNAPDVPFWYKAVTGNDKWVHLLGTAQGQYDIPHRFYRRGLDFSNWYHCRFGFCVLRRHC